MKGIKGFQKGHGRIRTEASYKKAGEKISKSKIGKKNWKISGENHYLYTGNTSLVEKIRKCLEYYQWRDFVFKRDSYSCTECGDSGVYLHADHIKQFSFIIREHAIKTMEQALACKELWDTDNGRTMCVPCHRKQEVYSYDGKRNVTFKMR